MTSVLVALLSVAIVAGIVLVSERLWRQKKISGETARKLVHLTLGVVVAFWPFFLNTTWIVLLCAANLATQLFARRFSIIRGGYDVKRKTVGEMLYPIGIAVCALFKPNKWIFLAAILHLGIADALAALVGTKYGKDNRYKVWGETKSFAGSFAFLLTSMLIIVFVVQLSPSGLGYMILPALLWIPVITTLLEGVGVNGTDNITVPLFVVLALSALQLVV